MNEGEVVPDINTYSYLVHTFGCLGKCRRLDVCRMRTLTVSNTDPDAGTYNIVIQVFGEAYFREVVTLFHDMVDENIEPNMETCEDDTAMKCFGWVKQLQSRIINLLNADMNDYKRAKQWVK
ncbi:pentatricopeptide repeat-containing protein chloroplastic-like [Trifolium pratense]|uniref:Pentatricopeptide repeat-containing protein chloroplastic-like n=1 Tax=Trifolium pratense TaxID=57577 RepID=A0A2K3LKN2_TRIPR|nr:pentatricopeptide repeat-containing protein chloroplastic-like [Trifolium pratense]